MNMQEQFKRAQYNHLIKKLKICNIQLSENEENGKFEEFFRYMAYLGFNCITSSTLAARASILHKKKTKTTQISIMASPRSLLSDLKKIIP